MAQDLTTINISLPASMLADLKDLVKAGHFASVSEAIRAGINQIKVSLHPKYKNIKLGPNALRNFAQAEQDYREGKLPSFDNVDDLMTYLSEQSTKKDSKYVKALPVSTIRQKSSETSPSKPQITQ
jgi:Arc/MetJ-type ribon-helix-helix transcriptional regulator